MDESGHHTSLKCVRSFHYVLHLCFLYDTILAFKIKHIYIEQNEMNEKDEFFEKNDKPLDILSNIVVLNLFPDLQLAKLGQKSC